MKRPKWLGESRATKVDKQKKARQQTDQRMKTSGRRKERRQPRDARGENGPIA
jgi:hypothetical protein